MSVTAADTASHLQGVDAAEARRGAERKQRLVQHMPAARRLLVERYGAGRVWVFGSLVREDATPNSDVDLAVVGLPAATYFDALADLMALFGARVDLVCLEQASTSLRERVQAEGHEL